MKDMEQEIHHVSGGIPLSTRKQDPICFLISHYWGNSISMHGVLSSKHYDGEVVEMFGATATFGYYSIACFAVSLVIAVLLWVSLLKY